MDKPIKSIKQLAIDDLYRIGTPDAAVKLVPFLWDQYQDFAIYVAWHLGVLLKNPEVEEKLSKYQLKSEQTPVDELTYIWRPFEANSDSALFTITSRLAYLIIVSSTENIPQPILPVDPRTIIPISALETINSVKLPTKTDSQVDELLAESNITPELENNFKDKVNILLGYQQLGNNWTIKLSSISPRLQLDLLYRLIHVRSSSNSDWRNLKKDVQYNFAQGWHYKSILGISLILSLIVGTELFKLITNFFRNNDYNIINWFSLLSSSSIFLLIFCFWVALWQGIEERWEPRLFILFGLFGLFTFFQQLTYLWINNFVWAGINSLYNAVILKEDINHRELDSAVLVFFAIAGVGAAVLTQNLIAAVALAIVGRLALAGAILTTRVGLRGWFWGMAMIVLISLAFAVIWPWVLTNSYAALSAWILLLDLISVTIVVLPEAIAGVGLGAWYRAKDKRDWGRYLTILAFPFFCTFPIILGYSSYAFYDWFGFTWQQITIIGIAILGVCTVLWQWGQKLDYEARNPFKGILDTVKNDSDFV